MRRAILVVALLASTGAVLADDAPAKASQFLDKSIVTVPKSAGAYRLQRADYDVAKFTLGVSTNWSLAAAPENLIITVYAYPIGRGPEDKVVADQIAEVEGALREAAKREIYTELTVGERTPFVVVSRQASVLEDGKKPNSGEAPFDPNPRPESTAEAIDSTDPIVAAAVSSEPPANSHGVRQSFRFKNKGVAMRSLGYVFYRHLFAFKVRVSVPEADLDQVEFERHADDAARNLVPRIDVQNFGECGTITLSVPDAESGKGEESHSTAVEMIRGMSRVQLENCASSEGRKPAPVPGDSDRIVIEYPPGTWKSN